MNKLRRTRKKVAKSHDCSTEAGEMDIPDANGIYLFLSIHFCILNDCFLC